MERTRQRFGERVPALVLFQVKVYGRLCYCWQGLIFRQSSGSSIAGR